MKIKCCSFYITAEFEEMVFDRLSRDPMTTKLLKDHPWLESENSIGSQSLQLLMRIMEAAGATNVKFIPKEYVTNGDEFLDIITRNI